jgi:hypothetical protein
LLRIFYRSMRTRSARSALAGGWVRGRLLRAGRWRPTMAEK